MDNIHYIQAFLNPVYKHLKKIGVLNARIQTLYKKIEKILQGIRRELPQLFNESEDEANSSEGDSDKDDVEQLCCVNILPIKAFILSQH